jgi:ribose-phosphate pyrophosphokinase
MVVFSGRSNPALAERIAQHLGHPLGLCDIKSFSDGEVWVKYKENVRGRDVFIVQSTNPPATNLIELLIMIDAAKRASADRVTAVIPYFGYARQDRKDQPRVAITSKLVANLITSAGADRIISMDLHAPQIQGFFDIPLDHLYASAVFIKHFMNMNIPNLAVVAPDVGGISRARSYAKRLEAELVVLDKRRPRPNEAKVMNIIGTVEGKNVLLIDDLIDTGNTFQKAVMALKNAGAQQIWSAATHPVLSGQAIELLGNTPVEKLFVTDTIPLTEKARELEVLDMISVSKVFAEAIVRTHRHQSISSLFDIDKDKS